MSKVLEPSLVSVHTLVGIMGLMESSHAIICPKNIIFKQEVILLGTIINYFKRDIAAWYFKFAFELYENNMFNVTVAVRLSLQSYR